MKTIAVIFSDSTNFETNRSKKRYCFNTDSDVSIGDVLQSKSYDTSIVVMDVLGKSYKYFERGTGRLTDTKDSVNCFDIATLKVLDTDQEDIVFAKKL